MPGLYRGNSVHRLQRLVTACVLSVLVAAPIQAQAPAAKPPENPGTRVETPVVYEPAGSTSKAATAGETMETIRLPSGDGKAIDVPVDASLKKYLEWLKAQTTPAYSILETDLTGTVDDERADLSAKVRVLIHRDDEWVEIPIAMNEAVLKDVAHAGAGEYQPVVPYEREKGHRWLLKGRGEHQLTFSLSLRVSKTAPLRRMLLTIAPTAVSRLKLRLPVPADRLAVRPLRNSQLRKSASGADASEIEIFGLDNPLQPAFDLQWELLPEQRASETVLQSNTSINLGAAGESMLLEAHQTLAALQGSFSEATVQLPAGFTLLKVEGRALRSRGEVEKGNRVTFRLNEATAGPVQLRWILEAKFPPAEGVLTLDGFDVVGAREQEGTIAIQPVEGFRISASGRGGQNRYVRQVNLSSLQDKGNFVAAYSFLQQPFRLVLDVKEIEPYFTLDPRVLLKLAADQAELEAHFHFDVPPKGGAVEQIELNWPGRKQEGWIIEPIDSPGIAERADIEQMTDDGSIRIPLARKMTEQFEVVVRAHRPIPSGSVPFPLTLPTGTASRVSPTALIAWGADNVEFDLAPSKETTVRPLPNSVLAGVKLPQELDESRRRDLEITSPAHAFQATVAVHQQSILAETTVTAELRDHRLLVTQRLSYAVEYERLSQVRLIVPDEIPDPVNFYLNEDTASDANPNSSQGVELIVNWAPREPGAPRNGRVTLEPRLGKFDVVARYLVELPGELTPGTVQESSIPLIRAADVDFTRVQFRFPERDFIAATVPDIAWKQQILLDNTTAWTATAPITKIPLKLNYSLTDSGGTYSIERALVRSIVDQNGLARSRGQYRIEGPVLAVVVSLPAQIEPEAFYWNQDVLPASAVAEIPAGSRRYRLDVSSTAAGERQSSNLLTIDFNSTSGVPLAWSSGHSLSSPSFPSNVWIRQSLWEISLPIDQLLFIPPRDQRPQYRWERTLFFWIRRPQPPYDDPARWISAVDGPPEHADFLQPANAYQFSRFGHAANLNFTIMSRAVVLLFGAGLTLAVGFVLLRIPATRNVLTLLIVGFAAALLGIWFAEPSRLLLQPAALGLLLAVSALFIDNAVKKRRTPATVFTISTPSDFVLPSASSFVENAGLFGAPEDAPTEMHHTPSPRQEPVSSSEAGSQQ